MIGSDDRLLDVARNECRIGWPGYYVHPRSQPGQGAAIQMKVR